jgi:calcineurin-like phosphoesterase family protein
MDEEMVRRWNEVVKDGDKIYHLGDVVINQKFINILGRLNGTKRLVRGNHDIFKTKVYLEYFKEIYGIRVLEDIVLTHVPLHRESITQRWGTNVHGHLHANIVTKQSPYSNRDEDRLLDPLYCNVSVEQIDYRPIEFSELRERIRKNRQLYGDPSHGSYVHKK